MKLRGNQSKSGLTSRSGQRQNWCNLRAGSAVTSRIKKFKASIYKRRSKLYIHMLRIT
jgi:hypothetical protein